jgi:photosystem II stability/assembly factor-like uncharacterized protein
MKIKIIYLILVLSFTIVTCKKKATVEPISSVSEDTIWTTLNYPYGCYNDCIAICNNQIYIGDNYLFDSTFRSIDNGNSWQPIISNTPFGAIRGIASTHGNSFFAVSGGGLFRSNDAGNSWVTSGIIAAFWGININSAGRIFASTKQSGLFISTTNGDSWTQIRTGLGYFNAYTCIAVKTDSLLFMGGDGLFRSKDSGESWTSLDSTGSVISFVWAMGIDRSGEIVIANDRGSDGSGIYVSSDNGDTWTQKRNPGSSCLVINSQGDIFIGGYHAPGVFRSSDNGTSWNPFGFKDDIINALAVDSLGFLYTSITGKGVFRTRVSTLW